MNVKVCNCLFCFLEKRRAFMEKKEKTGNNKKKVRVVVTPVYTGGRKMSEVFGDIAVENARRRVKAV